ncbi:hypothetical protein HN51_039746 [Arachis hypogaea]
MRRDLSGGEGGVNDTGDLAVARTRRGITEYGVVVRSGMRLDFPNEKEGEEARCESGCQGDTKGTADDIPGEVEIQDLVAASDLGNDDAWEASDGLGNACCDDGSEAGTET